jgi:hypothetical protein
LAKLKNFSRYSCFDEETKALVLDWLAANYSGEVGALICEAVAAHIQGRLGNEPEMRKRFEKARARRSGGEIVPIRPKPQPVASASSPSTGAKPDEPPPRE